MCPDVFSLPPSRKYGWFTRLAYTMVYASYGILLPPRLEVEGVPERLIPNSEALTLLHESHYAHNHSHPPSYHLLPRKLNKHFVSYCLMVITPRPPIPVVGTTPRLFTVVTSFSPKLVSISTSFVFFITLRHFSKLLVCTTRTHACALYT